MHAEVLGEPQQHSSLLQSGNLQPPTGAPDLGLPLPLPEASQDLLPPGVGSWGPGAAATPTPHSLSPWALGPGLRRVGLQCHLQQQTQQQGSGGCTSTAAAHVLMVAVVPLPPLLPAP